MMDLTNLSKRQWITIGGVIVGVLVLYILLKHSLKGKKDQVAIQVKLEDQDGYSMGSYDPSDMVATLQQVLTTTYWWDASERCEAIRHLLSLSDPKFMAVIYGYNKHTGMTIIEAMSKCWKVCNTVPEEPFLSDYELVERRFNILKSTYKEQESVQA